MPLLRGGRLSDGRVVDIRTADGHIAEVADGGALAGRPGEEVVELAGRLVLPAPVEPHGHLDKALTADAVPNPAGDLLGAIDAWVANLPDLTGADKIGRAHV